MISLEPMNSKKNRTLFLLLGVATIVTGLLFSLGTGVLFSTWAQRVEFNGDSTEYLQLAEMLIGKNDHVLARTVLLRPPLFPAYLISYLLFGSAGFVSLQLLLSISSVFLLFLGLLNLTASRIWSFAGALFLSLIPSFQLLAFFALTETLTVFLSCVAIYLFSRWYRTRRLQDWLFLTLAAGLLTLVKQAVFPLYLMCMLGLLVHLYRARAGHLRGFLVTLILSGPFMVQMAYSQIYAGTFSMGTTGTFNFDVRFFPAVYGQAKFSRFVDYQSEEAKTAEKEFPSHEEKVDFVRTHALDALRMYFRILWEENVRSGSNHALLFKGSFARPIWEWSRIWNRVLLAQFFLSCLVVVYRRQYRADAIWFALSGLLLLVGAPMTYWQGDRILLVSMPFLIAASVCNWSDLSLTIPFLKRPTRESAGSPT